MFLNKLVGFLINPLTVGLFLLAASLVMQGLRRRCAAAVCTLAALIWFWFWSTPACYLLLGGALERPYPPREASEMPRADAIVILGGGMGCNTNFPYAEMWDAADRVWHASRLYAAGRAPVVIPSGTGEEYSSVPLLRDLDVPPSAILVEPHARNTEENAQRVERLVRHLPGLKPNARPRILLVTSAWHMRRSQLLFERTSLEVIPAATDHEAGVRWREAGRWKQYLPNYDALGLNGVLAKEYLGYVLYRVKVGVAAWWSSGHAETSL